MGNIISQAIKAALHSPIEVIRKEANKIILNRLGYIVEPRPRPLSMAADYTTWRGLTDRVYSGRQLPADEEFNKDLPPMDDVLNLFQRNSRRSLMIARHCCFLSLPSGLLTGKGQLF